MAYNGKPEPVQLDVMSPSSSVQPDTEIHDGFDEPVAAQPRKELKGDTLW